MKTYVAIVIFLQTLIMVVIRMMMTLKYVDLKTFPNLYCAVGEWHVDGNVFEMGYVFSLRFGERTEYVILERSKRIRLLSLI